MADQVNREVVDDVDQRRQIQHVFGDAIERARRPGAVAVAAQIHGVDVKMLAERARHPIPVAGVIQTAVDQHQSGLAVLSPIPELELEAVGVVSSERRVPNQLL